MWWENLYLMVSWWSTWMDLIWKGVDEEKTLILESVKTCKNDQKRVSWRVSQGLSRTGGKKGQNSLRWMTLFACFSCTLIVRCMRLLRGTTLARELPGGVWSSLSFIRLPRFIRSRRPTPLLDPSLVPKWHILVVYLCPTCGFYAHHSLSVTLFPPRLSPFLLEDTCDPYVWGLFIIEVVAPTRIQSLSSRGCGVFIPIHNKSMTQTPNLP